MLTAGEQLLYPRDCPRKKKQYELLDSIDLLDVVASLNISFETSFDDHQFSKQIGCVAPTHESIQKYRTRHKIVSPHVPIPALVPLPALLQTNNNRLCSS